MADTSLIQITEVSELRVFRNGFPSRNGTQRMQLPQPILASLDDISTRAQELLVPTYLPEGYAFHHGITNGNQVRLRYQKDAFLLQVTQGLPAYKCRVQRGFVEPKYVAGYEGYLIRGCWSFAVHKGNTTPTQADWSPFIMSVVFQRDDKVIELKTWPYQPQNGSANETGLLEIASSRTEF